MEENQSSQFDRAHSVEELEDSTKLALSRKSVFAAYKDIHYSMNPTEVIPLDWECIYMEDGSVFVYDPQKIIVKYILEDDLIEKNIQNGWNSVGKFIGRTILVAPPRFLLEYEKVEDVTLTVDKIGRSIIKCGTLQLLMEIMATDPLDGSDETSLYITIEREAAQKSDYKQERNPHLAENSIFSDLRKLILQLKDMGYKKIYAFPTDERREKTYKRMGMKNFNDSRDLYCEIDTLLSN